MKITRIHLKHASIPLAHKTSLDAQHHEFVLNLEAQLIVVDNKVAIPFSSIKEFLVCDVTAIQLVEKPKRLKVCNEKT